jgi:hypothetical protein
MQHDHPIIIKKAGIGLVAILLSGLILFAVLLFAMYQSLTANGTHGLTLVVAFAAVVVLLATAVQAYVYSLSQVVLTDAGMKVASWNSLFSESEADTLYQHIEDVDVKRSGVFAMVFGYGTLYVQTAGTERNLKLPMIANAEYWKDELDRRVGAAKTLVSVS